MREYETHDINSVLKRQTFDRENTTVITEAKCPVCGNDSGDLLGTVTSGENTTVNFQCENGHQFELFFEYKNDRTRLSVRTLKSDD